MYESLQDNSHKITIKNLDKFLINLYNFFVRKGFYCILFENIVNLLILGFIIFFIVFLSSFIDYDYLLKTYDLNKSVNIQYSIIPNYMVIFIIITSLMWIRQLIITFHEIIIYLKIKKFYNEQLNIYEDDIQSISWNTVLKKLCNLDNITYCDNIPTPLEITNRIMRRDNYLIALINKNIIDFSINIPLYGEYVCFTKTLEWAIYITIIHFIFDNSNNVKIDFLNKNYENRLSLSLKYRFYFIGIISLIFSPFILLLLFAYFIFKYGQEYKLSNNIINTRQWSVLSKWKFREFNELSHIFQNRLNKSYNSALNYVNQFPSYKLYQISRFIEFISSAFFIVIIIFSINNPEILTKLTIFDNKSGLWLLGILGSIISICRTLIPDENFVFEPNNVMKELVNYTHYMPDYWRDKCSTIEIYNIFKNLFNFKILIFVNEILGIIITPFILIFYFPHLSSDIVNFIRENTVDIKNIGYVCSFAEFNFERNGNPKYGMTNNLNINNHSNDGKMERSYLYFSDNYTGIKSYTGLFSVNDKEKYLNNINSPRSLNLDKHEICLELNNIENTINTI